MQVALSINVRSEAEVRDRVLRAQRIVGVNGMVHMDIHPQSFMGVHMPEAIQTEVHLMVRDWEERLVSWLEAGAFRAIIPADYIHIDSMRRAHDIALRYGASIMVSFSSAHNLPDLALYATCTAFQVLAVPAGMSGHSFDTRAIEKIKVLRATFPNAILEVDGGMTPIIAARMKEAGANIVVSASCIWNASNPHDTYNTFQRI